MRRFGANARPTRRGAVRALPILVILALGGGAAAQDLPQAKPTRPPRWVHGAQLEELVAQYEADIQAAAEGRWSRLRALDATRALGWLYEDVGDLDKAEAFYRKAVEGLESQGRRGTDEHIEAVRDLAWLHLQKGGFERAEGLLLDARERSAPGSPARFKTDLYLAELYREMGDFARAEPLYRGVLARSASTPEEPDADLAALHNLAVLYERMKRFDEAESILRQEVSLSKHIHGERSPSHAHSLSTLALVLSGAGKLAEAESLFGQALETVCAGGGEGSAICATTLANHGYLLMVSGELERAVSRLEDAAERRRRLFGAGHLSYADTLNDLALAYSMRGEWGRAEDASSRAVDITLRNLGLAATAQSERQQLAMLELVRERLGRYLAIASKGEFEAESAYSRVLSWKGAVFRRQRRLRLAQDAPAATASRFGELERAAGRVAALVLSGPPDAPHDRTEWRRQVDELEERRETLERDLARDSGAFRDFRGEEQRTPAAIQAALPDDTVLVDYVEYTARVITREHLVREETSLLAFVVRRRGRVALVGLGSMEPISKAIAAWRVGFGTDGASPTRLRQLVWDPLTPHLGDVGTVLVSPDGALGRVPFAALPATNGDRYLIEERGVALVPVPQLLPELLESTDREAGRSLLVVGEVDYGASPGGSASESHRAVRRGALQDFSPLLASRGEILAVRDSFERRFAGGRVTTLRRDAATEARFREEAPRHRIVHLATHGFFAADLEQGGPGLHPGVLSGVALAGANAPPDLARDDGILTGIEIGALDLSGVDTAVLSACETGLGEAASGEGLLGLQRAFQVAGAGTVVATLWSVDDEATRSLMERFYENLWERGMGKLAALREAQLWMLREAPVRGIAEESAGRAPPYYWAAFVLSGAWQ